MQQVKRLQLHYGPWAVVTGASDGIGKAFALELAGHGMNIALVARRRTHLEMLAGELKAAHGSETLVIACDLSVPSGIDAVVNATRELDVGLLVNAAGFGTSGQTLRADLARERAMLALNCGASFELCIHFGRRFAVRGRGGIVLMSSLVGWQGNALCCPLCGHESLCAVSGGRDACRTERQRG